VLAESPSSPNDNGDNLKPSTRTVQVLKLHRPDEEGGEGIPLVSYSNANKRKGGRKRKGTKAAANISISGGGSGGGGVSGNGNVGAVGIGDEEKRSGEGV